MEPNKRSSTWFGSPIGLRPDQTTSLALLLESPSLSYNLKGTAASRHPQQNLEQEYDHSETRTDSPLPTESNTDSSNGATGVDGEDVLEELSRRAANFVQTISPSCRA